MGAKPFWEKVVEAPAVVLDETVEASTRVVKKIGNSKPLQKPKQFWHNLGPGLTTGASDDDPSGVATYSQTGAQFGFQFLWLAAFTFPLMAIVQEMCARIGLVTGRGLAANIRRHFPKTILYLCTGLLFLANSFNIGADLGAMAEATKLIFPTWHFSLLIAGFAVLSLILQIYSTYEKYAHYLKWLALILLAYVFSALMVNGINWGEVIKSGLWPENLNFAKDQLVLVCAILGTTISPYLFFWQTSQEVEEDIQAGHTSIHSRVESTTPEEIKKMRIDVWSGMFLSNLVMFFIIVACGATLFRSGITDIQTAAQAAEALRPFAGDQAYFLFTLGILGTGLLAIPVLAGSSSYALAEAFGWKTGLHRKLKQARAFYGIIILSTVVGWLSNYIGLDPIRQLIYAAVGNGLIAPIVLVLIMLLAGNRHVMGEWRNGHLSTIFGWMVTLIMTVAGVGTIWAIFF